MKNLKLSILILALVLFTSGLVQASVLNMGQVQQLSIPDNSNGDLLVTQQATLPQSAYLESFSFYVTNAAGSLILGLYDATGENGGPGKLVATTAAFSPVVGWNTQPAAVPGTPLNAGVY